MADWRSVVFNENNKSSDPFVKPSTRLGLVYDAVGIGPPDSIETLHMGSFQNPFKVRIDGPYAKRLRAFSISQAVFYSGRFNRSKLAPMKRPQPLTREVAWQLLRNRNTWEGSEQLDLYGFPGLNILNMHRSLKADKKTGKAGKFSTIVDRMMEANHSNSPGQPTSARVAADFVKRAQRLIGNNLVDNLPMPLTGRTPYFIDKLLGHGWDKAVIDQEIQRQYHNLPKSIQQSVRDHLTASKWSAKALSELEKGVLPIAVDARSKTELKFLEIGDETTLRRRYSGRLGKTHDWNNKLHYDGESLSPIKEKEIIINKRGERAPLRIQLPEPIRQTSSVAFLANQSIPSRISGMLEKPSNSSLVNIFEQLATLDLGFNSKDPAIRDHIAAEQELRLLDRKLVGAREIKDPTKQAARQAEILERAKTIARNASGVLLAVPKTGDAEEDFKQVVQKWRFTPEYAQKKKLTQGIMIKDQAEQLTSLAHEIMQDMKTGIKVERGHEAKSAGVLGDDIAAALTEVFSRIHLPKGREDAATLMLSRIPSGREWDPIRETIIALQKKGILSKGGEGKVEPTLKVSLEHAIHEETRNQFGASIFSAQSKEARIRKMEEYGFDVIKSEEDLMPAKLSGYLKLGASHKITHDGMSPDELARKLEESYVLGENRPREQQTIAFGREEKVKPRSLDEVLDLVAMKIASGEKINEEAKELLKAAPKAQRSHLTAVAASETLTVSQSGRLSGDSSRWVDSARPGGPGYRGVRADLLSIAYEEAREKLKDGQRVDGREVRARVSEQHRTLRSGNEPVRQKLERLQSEHLVKLQDAIQKGTKVKLDGVEVTLTSLDTKKGTLIGRQQTIDPKNVIAQMSPKAWAKLIASGTNNSIETQQQMVSELIYNFKAAPVAQNEMSSFMRSIDTGENSFKLPAYIKNIKEFDVQVIEAADALLGSFYPWLREGKPGKGSVKDIIILKTLNNSTGPWFEAINQMSEAILSVAGNKIKENPAEIQSILRDSSKGIQKSFTEHTLDILKDETSNSLLSNVEIKQIDGILRAVRERIPRNKRSGVGSGTLSWGDVEAQIKEIGDQVDMKNLGPHAYEKIKYAVERFRQDEEGIMGLGLDMAGDVDGDNLVETLTDGVGQKEARSIRKMFRNWKQVREEGLSGADVIKEVMLYDQEFPRTLAELTTTATHAYEGHGDRLGNPAMLRDVTSYLKGVISDRPSLEDNIAKAGSRLGGKESLTAMDRLQLETLLIQTPEMIESSALKPHRNILLQIMTDWHNAALIAGSVREIGPNGELIASEVGRSFAAVHHKTLPKYLNFQDGKHIGAFAALADEARLNVRAYNTGDESQGLLRRDLVTGHAMMGGLRIDDDDIEFRRNVNLIDLRLQDINPYEEVGARTAGLGANEVALLADGRVSQRSLSGRYFGPGSDAASTLLNVRAWARGEKSGIFDTEFIKADFADIATGGHSFTERHQLFEASLLRIDDRGRIQGKTRTVRSQVFPEIAEAIQGRFDLYRSMESESGISAALVSAHFGETYEGHTAGTLRAIQKSEEGVIGSLYYMAKLSGAAPEEIEAAFERHEALRRFVIKDIAKAEALVNRSTKHLNSVGKAHQEAVEDAVKMLNSVQVAFGHSISTADAAMLERLGGEKVTAALADTLTLAKLAFPGGPDDVGKYGVDDLVGIVDRRSQQRHAESGHRSADDVKTMAPILRALRTRIEDELGYDAADILAAKTGDYLHIERDGDLKRGYYQIYGGDTSADSQGKYGLKLQDESGMKFAYRKSHGEMVEEIQRTGRFVHAGEIDDYKATHTDLTVSRELNRRLSRGYQGMEALLDEGSGHSRIQAAVAARAGLSGMIPAADSANQLLVDGDPNVKYYLESMSRWQTKTPETLGIAAKMLEENDGVQGLRGGYAKIEAARIAAMGSGDAKLANTSKDLIRGINEGLTEGISPLKAGYMRSLPSFNAEGLEVPLSFNLNRPVDSLFENIYAITNAMTDAGAKTEFSEGMFMLQDHLERSGLTRPVGGQFASLDEISGMLQSQNLPQATELNIRAGVNRLIENGISPEFAKRLEGIDDSELLGAVTNDPVMRARYEAALRGMSDLNAKGMYAPVGLFSQIALGHDEIKLDDFDPTAGQIDEIRQLAEHRRALLKKDAELSQSSGGIKTDDGNVGNSIHNVTTKLSAVDVELEKRRDALRDLLKPAVDDKGVAFDFPNRQALVSGGDNPLDFVMLHGQKEHLGRTIGEIMQTEGGPGNFFPGGSFANDYKPRDGTVYGRLYGETLDKLHRNENEVLKKVEENLRAQAAQRRIDEAASQSGAENVNIQHQEQTGPTAGGLPTGRKPVDPTAAKQAFLHITGGDTPIASTSAGEALSERVPLAKPFGRVSRNMVIGGGIAGAAMFGVMSLASRTGPEHRPQSGRAPRPDGSYDQDLAEQPLPPDITMGSQVYLEPNGLGMTVKLKTQGPQNADQINSLVQQAVSGSGQMSVTVRDNSSRLSQGWLQNEMRGLL